MNSIQNFFVALAAVAGLAVAVYEGEKAVHSPEGPWPSKEQILPADGDNPIVSFSNVPERETAREFSLMRGSENRAAGK